MHHLFENFTEHTTTAPRNVKDLRGSRPLPTRFSAQLQQEHNNQDQVGQGQKCGLRASSFCRNTTGTWMKLTCFALRIMRFERAYVGQTNSHTSKNVSLPSSVSSAKASRRKSDRRERILQSIYTMPRDLSCCGLPWNLGTLKVNIYKQMWKNYGKTMEKL